MLQKGGKMRTVSVLTPEREGARGHDSCMHGQETVGRHRNRQGVVFTMHGAPYGATTFIPVDANTYAVASAWDSSLP